MGKLEDKLQRFYPTPSSGWQMHCLDVAALPIDQYEGKSLVIIAGVGGELITEFITAIHTNHSTTNIDFLLCPVHHQFTLRQRLIELDFTLNDEVLVEENNRFYEILLVSSIANTGDSQAMISPVGELIWQASTAEQSKIAVSYLNQTLDHFLRMQQGSNADIQHVIDAYKKIMHTMSDHLKSATSADSPIREKPFVA